MKILSPKNSENLLKYVFDAELKLFSDMVRRENGTYF